MSNPEYMQSMQSRIRYAKRLNDIWHVIAVTRGLDDQIALFDFASNFHGDKFVKPKCPGYVECCEVQKAHPGIGIKEAAMMAFDRANEQAEKMFQGLL